MNKYAKISLDGLIFQNPTFMLVLGTCPTLGLISSASSAAGMGLTVVVILTLSNMLISALRKVIPNEVRIPAYIVIIATLVTLARMVLEKFVPDLYDSLGGFLALIVVNCIILGRAEAFASKHTVIESALDGVATGLGFTAALTIMGIICEFLGSGSIFGLRIMDFTIGAFATPAGSFLVYGTCIAVFVYIMDTIERVRREKKYKHLTHESLVQEVEYMGTFIVIVLAAVLTNNFITVRTYGICPFLGVSKKTSSAVGMGVAVTIVMAIATAVTYPLYEYVMVPLGIDFLEIIFFIFIIAALVQMIEKVIQKLSPTLYNAMGIYLPLITTNCAVLGVCELVIGDMSSIIGTATMNTGWAVLYAVFAGLGFTLVMVIMSGLRERIGLYSSMPKAIKGFPIAMITASIICMAFTVFSYIQV